MKRILIILYTSAILMTTGIWLSASLPQPPSIGSWSQTGNLSGLRAGAAAATLQDGRVLATGGDPGDGSGPQATADIINTDGTIPPAPPMNNARSQHVSVALQDGRVLVAGGVTTNGSTTATAEIFDPVANSWSAAGLGMMEARSGATAGLLPDGRVVVVGGQNGTAISSTIEIFDPNANAFSYAAVALPSTPTRTQYAMAVLQDGRVLIVGGFDGTAPLASTYIFDLVANTVNQGPNLAVARFGHSATTLLNGQVLVVGGNNGSTTPGAADLASAEIFDPTAGTFTTAPATLGTPREGHLAFLLPNNNNVLITGGTSAGAALASSEVFSPWQGTFVPTSNSAGTITTMAAARSSATGAPNQVSAPSSVAQRNGVLMVAGGNDVNGNALNSVESYGFATVQTDQRDYPPGTTVNISGSGWQPGETVTLTLVESPFFDTHGPFPILADANGNISDSSFVTDSHDLDVKFTLTAVGSVSQAQMTFTDAGQKPSSTITFPAPAGSYNSAGWTGTITGTATFASGTTSRVVNVSVERNGAINKCWNGSAFAASCPNFLATSGTPTLWTLSFPSSNFPADDSYTVQSQAKDSNGTEAGNTTATFTIDNTAPAKPSKPTLAPGSDSGISQSDGITNATTNLKFNGTAEANSTVNLYVDGSPTSSGSGTANNGGNWTIIIVALSEGTYTIKATATDAAGNVSPLSDPLTITIDTTAPTAAITSNPTNPTTSTSATFIFTGTDPTSGGVSSGVDHFLCKLDAAAFAICTSPDTLTGLAAGSHTFQVEAVDVAGNIGTPASYTWTVITQFGVTFTAVDTSSNALSGTGSATIVTYTGTQSGTVHSNVTLTASGLGTPILFDAGTSLTYTYSSPVAAGTGKQYVLTSTSPASIASLSAATTVTGTYKIQYQVTFEQTGLASDAGSNTVLTLAGPTTYNFSQFNVTQWVDNGTGITYSYAATVGAGTGKQYALTSTTPATLSSVTAATIVTGAYKTQWQVTFEQSGLSADAGSNTVLTLAGPTTYNFSQFNVTQWVDNGTGITYSYAATVGAGTGKQYALTSTTPATLSSVTAATIVTGAYKTQWQVTFEQSGLSADAGSNTVLTLAGPTTYTFSQFNVTQWVDNGTGITYSYAATVGAGTGKQYVLTSTTPATLSSVTAATIVTGAYKTQWQVTFEQSGLSADAGSNTVLTLAGPTTYNFSQFNVTQWVDNGTGITYSYAATVGAGTGKQYALTSTTPATLSSVTAATIVTGAYKTQWQVTFEQSGLSADAGSNTVLTLAGPTTYNFSQFNVTQWVDNGTGITYSYAATVGAGTGKQYALTSTTPATLSSVTAATIVTGAYKTQWQVTFEQSGLSADAGSNTVLTLAGPTTYNFSQFNVTQWVDNGTGITYSYAATVGAGTGKQYVLTSTTPATLSSVTAATIVTGAYKTQWQVTFEQSGLSADAGSNTVLTLAGPTTYNFSQFNVTQWVDNGTGITYSYAATVGAGTGKQYALTSTTPATLSSVTAATIVTGAYKTQWQVTFEQSGLSADAGSNTVLTLAGPTTYTFSQFNVTQWVDNGTGITYSYAATVGAGTGKQYVLTSTTPATLSSVTAATIVTGAYKTQWQVTFEQSGLSADAGSNTILTLAGPTTYNFSQFNVTQWVDNGTGITYSYAATVGAGTGKQYVLTSTTPATLSSVTAATVVTGAYKTQWQVTFEQSGLSADAGSNTVLTLAGPTTYNFSQFNVTQWVDNGTGITYSYAATVGAGTGKQYALTSTTPATLSSVTAATIVTGAYKTQWQVTFEQSGLSADAGSNTILTLAGPTTYTFSQFNVTQWVDNGTGITYSYAATVGAGTGKQYVLTSTTPATLSSVTAATIVTGAYKTQWQVTFEQSGLSADAGSNTILTLAGPTTYTFSQFNVTQWVDNGIGITYSYAATVGAGTGKQYVLTSTTPATLSSVTAATIVTGAYKTQWQVTFTQSGIGSDTGSNQILSLQVNGGTATTYNASTLPPATYYDAGTALTYTYSSPVATSPASGKRYVLDTSVNPNPSPASIASLSAVTTVTGTYKTQYQVTFTQSGIGSDTGSNQVLSLQMNAGTATTYSASTLPPATYYDAGTALTYTYSSPVTTSPASGKRYVLDTSVNPNPSPASIASLSAVTTVTGTYKTQYQVTFTQSGIGSDTGSNQVLSLQVNAGTATTYSASTLPATYYDAGTALTYTYSSPVATSPASGKRYVLDTSVNPNPSPVSIASLSAVTTVTGTYKTQYLLMVAVNPSGIPSGIANITVSITTGSGSTSTNWYDSGTVLSLTASSTVSGTTADTGYVFTNWTGDVSSPPNTSNPVSVTMSAAKSVTANYTTWVLAWGDGTTTPSFTAQYSDVTGLYAILKMTPPNGTAAAVSGKAIHFAVGSDSSSPDPTTNATSPVGVATDTTDLHQPAASSYTASASCSKLTCGVALSITHGYTITQENASILYTGATVGQINFGLTLQATVWDSAAAGYTGINPESGPSATIGDITKMWIEFDIYPALSCSSGTPVASPIAEVANSPGSGIGTATTTFMSTTEASYCVIARLVNSSGSTNLYYTAPNAETATIAFYQDAGEFATGGGWIVDPTGSHGNFGFNARYGKKGTPSGQMVYVWRAMYDGVMADWIIKSTSQNLTALSFTQTGGTYPNSGLVQGGCVLQIIQESNGAAIGGQGNLTFTMEATDSGKSSGIGVDNYALTVLNGNTVIKSVSSTSLSGGNIVIHMQ